MLVFFVFRQCSRSFWENAIAKSGAPFLYLWMILNWLVIYTLIGLLVITIIDTLGAIASRKLDFNYAYLTPVSLAVYLLIGYFVSKDYGLYYAILSCCVTGLFDATIGWNLSLSLKANSGLTDEEIEKLTPYSRVAGMLGIASLFAFFGSLLAN